MANYFDLHVSFGFVLLNYKYYLDNATLQRSAVQSLIQDQRTFKKKELFLQIRLQTLNPRKELLPLRVESSETPPLYSERSRVNAESIYSTDTGYSSQHVLFTSINFYSFVLQKKRFPKTLLKDKVMLQYCGRRVVDSSPDETHSCSFESNISEVRPTYTFHNYFSMRKIIVIPFSLEIKHSMA